MHELGRVRIVKCYYDHVVGVSVIEYYLYKILWYFMVLSNKKLKKYHDKTCCIFIMFHHKKEFKFILISFILLLSIIRDVMNFSLAHPFGTTYVFSGIKSTPSWRWRCKLSYVKFDQAHSTNLAVKR